MTISNSSVTMAGWKRLTILLGLLLLVLTIKADDRNFEVYIDDFIVKIVDKDLINVFNCMVSHIPNRSFISCYLIVNRNIYELELNCTFDMILRNNQKRQVFNVKVNGCSFLVNLHKIRLFNEFAKSFSKVFNGNLTCPFYAVSLKNIERNNIIYFDSFCSFLEL